MVYEGIVHRMVEANQICDCETLINEAMMFGVIRFYTHSEIFVCLERFFEVPHETYN